MPNYTADPDAAAIAPDLGQFPGAEPVIDLPADGEAANAASVAQAWQVLANHVARLYKPRGTSSFTDPILPFRNEKDQIVSKIDAFALPGGPIQEYSEEFANSISEWLNTAASGFLLQNWGLRVEGAVSNSTPFHSEWFYGIYRQVAPGSTTPIVATVNPTIVTNRMTRGRGVRVETNDNATDDFSFIARRRPWAFANNILASLEFTLGATQAPGPSVNVGWLIPSSGLTFADFDPETAPNGVYVNINQDASANIRLVCGTTPTDTGIAHSTTATGSARIRLVYQATEIDMANTTRVLCFINDALVANVTANMPAVGSIPWFYAGGKCKTPGGLILRSSLTVSEIRERVFVRP